MSCLYTANGRLVCTGNNQTKHLGTMEPFAQYTVIPFTVVKNDIDYPGYDISNNTVQNANECFESCKRTPSCVGYVTTNNEKNCWLKNELMNKKTMKDRKVYYMGLEYNGKRFEGRPSTDYPYNADIDNKEQSNKTREECVVACANDPRCSGFVYDTTQPRCWLKSGSLLNKRENTPGRQAFIYKP